MSAFRDRAAIALLAHHNEGTALIRAQKMAEEACVKWGHDCATFYTETGSPHGHIGSPCKRCGAPAGTPILPTGTNPGWAPTRIVGTFGPCPKCKRHCRENECPFCCGAKP